MVSEPERQRLFFALWPDEALRLTLYKVTRRAVQASGGKPVAPENFHITLAFLGQLDASGAEAARQAAAATAGNVFDLVLDRLGFWPEARVVWSAPSAVPAAGHNFANTLRAELRARSIEVDVRPFLPHLTLARKVSRPGDMGTMHAVHWPVREFVLVRSVTGRHASEYHPLASWSLRTVSPEL